MSPTPPPPDTRDAGRGPTGRGIIRTATELTRRLAELLAPDATIVCIGNELRGDDAAGIEIARRLDGSVPWTVHQAETVPENFLMKIVAARPSAVLIVDAMHFDAPPGAVGVFDQADLAGPGPGTHAPSPVAFLQILDMMHPCRSAILGIQPACIEFGADLSPAVREAIDLVAAVFEDLAGGEDTS